MAKIILRANPDSNKLTSYVSYEQRKVVKDERGNETEQKQRMAYSRTPGTKLLICANPSMKKRGRLNTGLDIEVSNPYMEVTNFTDKQLEVVLKGKEKALLQHVLEYKWKRPFNYYHDNNVDTLHNPKADPDKISPFQKDEFMLELTQDTHIIDTNSEYGDVMQHIIKRNSLVANSYEERNSNTPYYISKEQEEEEKKKAKTLSSDYAISQLVDLQEKYSDQMIDFCKVLDLNLKNLNPSKSYNLIREFVLKHSENTKLFSMMYDMWANPSTKVNFKARVILRDAIDKGIVVKDGATYVWYPPKDENGNLQDKREFINYVGENSILEFLSAEKFAKFQKQVLEQIKRK
jgi:hypothetical protein